MQDHHIYIGFKESKIVFSERERHFGGFYKNFTLKKMLVVEWIH